MITLTVLATITCTVVLLHALGTRWPWEQAAAAQSVPLRQEPWH